MTYRTTSQQNHKAANKKFKHTTSVPKNQFSPNTPFTMFYRILFLEMLACISLVGLRIHQGFPPTTLAVGETTVVLKAPSTVPAAAPYLIKELPMIEGENGWTYTLILHPPIKTTLLLRSPSVGE
mgnify:CR=1 FL=1